MWTENRYGGTDRHVYRASSAFRGQRKWGIYRTGNFFWIVFGLIILILAGIALITFRFRGSKVIYAAENVLPDKEVVFYRQNDARWSEEKLGDSSYTLKSSGCLVCCIASAISMMDDKEETPLTLNEQFSEENVYDMEGNISWDRLRKAGNYEVDVLSEVSSDLLTGYLKEGKYPIARVRVCGIGNFHYVLIVKAEDEEFYCMDPLKDGLISLSEYGNRIYAVRCVYTAKTS